MKKDENKSYNEVNYFHTRFKRWINSKKWDYISERLSDSDIDILTRVMNCEYDEQLSWVVWRYCDYLLEKIIKYSKEIKI